MKKLITASITAVLFFSVIGPAFPALASPLDPYLSNQWYLDRIQASEAWALHNSSPTIVIAIVDSGVQINHPDLKANIWTNAPEIANNKKDDDKNGLVDDIHGWDFVNNVADPAPKFKNGYTEGGVLHGNIVAGIAAAAGNNGEGIAGIDWQAKIMPLKALDDKGNGDTGAVIKAIDYAVAKGANIINLSFVGFGYSKGLEDAVRRAYRAGVIVVAAAGNEQSAVHGLNLNTRPIYPACFRDTDGKKMVIGVAATDGIDQKAVFSGYGNSCIDIAAPGVSFYSTSVYAPEKSAAGKFFNQYYDGYWSGTSMAVPIVSGTIALIQGTNPGLSAKDVVRILYASADDINQLNPAYAGQLGAGRVNAFRAVMDTISELQQKQERFVFGAGIDSEPRISIFSQDGIRAKDFLAYRTDFKGGINVGAGDLNGDGNDEIVAAPNKDLESDIRIFSADGTFISHFLAYPYNFKGGVNLTVSDINNDGKAEIITAPNAGFEPLVKIFSAQGKLIKQFLAYPAAYKNGVALAAGDLRAESGKEIATVLLRGLPQVKIFSSQGAFLNSFMASKNTDLGGWRLAIGDLDGNPRRRQPELILAHQSGTPLIKTFDFRGNLRSQWSPYSAPFSGEVRLATGDLNRDGFTDIITVPGPGASSHVRDFDRLGVILSSFYAFDPAQVSGLSIAILTTNN